MRLMEQTPHAFVMRTVLIALTTAVAVGVTMRVAVARDGVAGGASRSYLTFAGTLRRGASPPGPTELTFRFRRRGDTAPLCAPRVIVTPTGDGTFRAEIPLENNSDMAQNCPSGLFDGSDTLVAVLAGTTEIAADAPVNPVPYAQHANMAANLIGRTGWQGVGVDQYVYSVFLRGSDVPSCVGGYMSYNIETPTGNVSRDALYDGSIHVVTRPDVPDFWNHTSIWSGRLTGYTHSGLNPMTCSWNGTCYDAGVPTTSFVVLRRPDVTSSRLEVIIPCGDSTVMSVLSIHINAFFRNAN